VQGKGSEKREWLARKALTNERGRLRLAQREAITSGHNVILLIVSSYRNDRLRERLQGRGHLVILLMV
jgi:hypothetical protein